MDGNTTATGYETNDLIPGNRAAAFGETHGNITDTFHHDTAFALILFHRFCINGLFKCFQRIFRSLCFAFFFQIFIFQTVYDLTFFQTAVTNSRQQCIPCFEIIFDNNDFHPFRTQQIVRLEAFFLQIRQNHFTAANDIFFLFLLLEPLFDLGSCLCRFNYIQPVPVRAFGVLGSNDLNDVTILDLMIDGNNFIIYPCADHLIADCRVDHICKVNGCGILCQLDNIALRCKCIHLCGEDVEVLLQRIKVFLIVCHVLLPFHDLTQPCQFFLISSCCLTAFFVCLAFFVFPMGSDTIFTGTMHFPCSDLHFKDLTLRADQCIMQRLIHIGLGHSDIVFETAGHRCIHGVYDTQNRITVLHIIYQRTDGKQVINLIHCFVLVDHFLINTEEMFCSAVNLTFDAGFIHFLLEIFYDILHEGISFFFLLRNFHCQIRKSLGIQIMETEVFHFGTDFGNTQTMCQRRIDIQCFLGFFPLFFRFHMVQGTHIVQPVRQFDQNYTDILCHGKEHLTVVFCLHFFLCRIGQFAQFCYTVYDGSDLFAEHIGDVFITVLCVLNDIMQDTCHDGFHIQF